MQSDWTLQEVIGVDHDANPVYKGINKHRQYGTVRIINYNISH